MDSVLVEMKKIGSEFSLPIFLCKSATYFVTKL